MKVLRNERGLSILEMLAALLIFGMVAAIIYSMLFMSMAVYQKVLVEGELRSRGEGMFSEILNELKDAEYVDNGPTGQISILYSKRSADKERYLEQYIMTIYPEGTPGAGSDVEVRDLEGTLIRSMDLGERFMVTRAELSAARDHDSVYLHLVYSYLGHEAPAGSQRLEMKIHSTISLFRNH